jgi:hypothetical protein
MFAPLCDWTDSRNGQMIVGGIALVAGAHLFLSGDSPVLGVISLPSFSLFGRSIGAQQVLGLAAALSGVCLLGSCCLGTGAKSGGSSGANEFAAEFLSA